MAIEGMFSGVQEKAHVLNVGLFHWCVLICLVLGSEFGMAAGFGCCPLPAAGIGRKPECREGHGSSRTALCALDFSARRLLVNRQVPVDSALASMPERASNSSALGYLVQPASEVLGRPHSCFY